MRANWPRTSRACAAQPCLPAEFADALAGLRDSGHVMPAAQLHRMLGREYGRGWRDRFEHFSDVPVAAASIGQVHRVTTTDGRDLALKIQFPGVAKSIGSDVDNLASLLRMARIIPEGIDVRPILDEVKRELRNETDYLREAASLARYRSIVGDEDLFRIPAVHDDLTTRHILAMDYIEARPINELWEGTHSQRLRDGVGYAMQRLLFRELFEFGFMQSDPNFANFLFSPEDGSLVLLDFGASIEIEPRLQAGYKRLCRAVIAGDRDEIFAFARDFDLLAADERRDRVEGLVDLLLLCCEPLRKRGRYDYGTTDLADRVRRASLRLAFERGLMRPPPPQSIFIHRKLGGTFMLCCRLGARIDTHKMIEPFLR